MALVQTISKETDEAIKETVIEIGKAARMVREFFYELSEITGKINALIPEHKPDPNK